MGVPSEEAGRPTIGDGDRSLGGRGGGGEATSMENVARGGGGGGPAVEWMLGTHAGACCCAILGVSSPRSSRGRNGGVLVASAASWSRDVRAATEGAWTKASGSDMDRW